MCFFYTKNQAKKFSDVGILHRLECHICPLYNLSTGINKNKDIAPQGPVTEGGIYILGQAPDKEDTKNGLFFSGRFSELLKSCVSVDQWKEFRVNNITRTRTPDKDGEAQEPSYETIECCRPSIERDIALVKPRIILGFGEPALKWVLPNNHDNKPPSIMAWRGHPFPIKIAGHTCWYYPIYHPDYVLEHIFLEQVFKLDIANAMKFAGKTAPAVVEDVSKASDNCVILTDISSIRTAFEELKKEKYAVGDLETHQARPYYADSRILTQAWGTYDKCFAFAYKHPQATWTDAEFAELQSIVLDFLLFPIKKIAHNAAFELEWFIYEHGTSIIKGPLRDLWEDTQAAAYVLGYGGGEKRSGEGGEFEEVSRVQRGLLALDNQTMVHLGFFLKSLSKVNRAKLLKEDLQKVLKYNVMDPKYTARVYDFLIQGLQEAGLMQVYLEQCRRVPSAVLTQRKGLVYSKEQAELFEKEYTAKLILKAEETMKHPAVVEYQTKFGGFNITTPADVAGLMKYLGFKTEDKEGKSKSGKDILGLIDHPIARNIISIRETDKIIGTYLKPFLDDDPDVNVTFPDGRLHTQFTTMFTTTSRLSSLDPNIQNFPKRANKQIRKIIICPPGHKFCSNDYGQIEARVLAMASKDPEFCKALWTGFDIHSYWALVIAQSYPKRVGGEAIVQAWTDAKDLEHLRKTDPRFKSFRDIVKNKWVFPAFFGASIKSLAGYMGIPYANAESVQKKFWKKYAVIKTWQDTLYAFYAKHGYIESLTGFRRYMYMQGGEIINHPIQATAAAIMLDAMNRLTRYAVETGQEQFIPNSSIHDDLGFYLPEESLEEDHKFIVKEMLSCKFDFINVPLTVESAVGTNWYDLKEIGTYSSDKL